MLIKATLLTELPEKKRREGTKEKDKKDLKCACVIFNRHFNCVTVLADWTDEGKVFQRIIARDIKLARLDILLTAGTGYGSLRN